VPVRLGGVRCRQCPFRRAFEPRRSRLKTLRLARLWEAVVAANPTNWQTCVPAGGAGLVTIRSSVSDRESRLGGGRWYQGPLPQSARPTPRVRKSVQSDLWTLSARPTVTNTDASRAFLSAEEGTRTPDLPRTRRQARRTRGRVLDGLSSHCRRSAKSASTRRTREVASSWLPLGMRSTHDQDRRVIVRAACAHPSAAHSSSQATIGSGKPRNSIAVRGPKVKFLPIARSATAPAIMIRPGLA